MCSGQGSGRRGGSAGRERDSGHQGRSRCGTGAGGGAVGSRGPQSASPLPAASKHLQGGRGFSEQRDTHSQHVDGGRSPPGLEPWVKGQFGQMGEALAGTAALLSSWEALCQAGDPAESGCHFHWALGSSDGELTFTRWHFWFRGEHGRPRTWTRPADASCFPAEGHRDLGPCPGGLTT